VECTLSGAHLSSVTSLSGLLQQGKTQPWSISRWRMPPACFISTWPDIFLVLQVPHAPLLQENGKRNPASEAACNIGWSARQENVFPIFWSWIW
jgi:hypothetical protein